MKRHTFRVYFFIKKSRLNSEGLAPINIRITIDRREVSFTSGIPIDPSLWDTHAQRLSGRSKVAREVNSALAKIQTYLLDLYHKIREHDGGVTSERLRDVFLGRENLCEQHTVLELFDKLICQKKLLAQNEVIKEVSANSYVCTKEKLVSYMHLYRKASDIDMKKIDYGFIDEFRTYLLTLGGCDHNTMIRHMRHLKQVTTDAYRNNYIDRDPFYDITLTVKKTERFFLSEEELVVLKEREIKTAWISGGRTQNIYIENVNRLDYMLVVRFKPLLFYNFLGIDNSIFKKTPILQLNQVVTRLDWINKFIDDIYSFSDIDKQIFYIDSFISSRIVNNIEFPMLEYILNIIDEKKGVISVSDIVKETGLNYKWLGRAFQSYIGMSPKEYLKSQRFLNSYLDLTDSKRHPLDIVANRGYYDYNHLMKDFKAYTGHTPYVCLQKR